MKTDSPSPYKKGATNWALTILFIPAWMILAGLCQLIALFIYKLISNTNSTIGEIASNIDITSLLLMQISMLVASLATTYIFWCLIQKQKYRDIGLNYNTRSFKEFIWGITTGLILISLIALALISSGNLEIKYSGFHWKYIVGYIVLFLLVSFNEELVSRGFLLGNFSKLTNKYLALIIVAFLFTFAHFFNANISVMGKINIFLAGILLGTPYIYTRSLWFPIGLHFSWNFFLGPIMGSNVSGNNMKHTIFSQKLLGKEFITGGDFGFEGSIVLSVVTILLIIILGIYFHRIAPKPIAHED